MVTISVIDAHCHLMDMKNADFASFSSPETIDNSDDGCRGVRGRRGRPCLEAIVNCGYDANSSTKAVEMKKGKLAGNVKLYANVGIGPQKCMGPDAMQKVAEIERIAREDERAIDAIGEVGLDYHWGDTTEKRNMQKVAFDALIALANELQKPIVIHSRETTSECIQLLDDAKFEHGVMFHFFSGNSQEAKAIADRGWLISLPPLRGGKMGIARAVDLENLVAETDAPYVGKTPLDVRKSMVMIAEAKGISFEEVEKETSTNVKEFFG